MSIESLFSEDDIQELQNAEADACIEAYVFSSPQEQLFIDRVLENMASEYGPEKQFPAKALALEAIHALRSTEFESELDMTEYMAAHMQKMQQAWSDKKVPVAVVAKTHEFTQVF